MIARAWWPLQRVVARHRLVCAAGVVVVVGWLLALHPSALSLWPVLAALCAAVTAGIAGAPRAAFAVVAAAALAACLPTDWSTMPLVATAIALTTPAAMMTARAVTGVERASARAAGYACIAGQLAVIACGAQDRRALPEALAIVAAAVLLPMIATQPTTTEAKRWRDLPPLPSPALAVRWRLVIGAALAAALAWSGPRLLPLDHGVAIAGACGVVLWRLHTGRWRCAVAAAIGCAAALGVEAQDARAQALGLGLGQCLPLLLWSWRDEPRRPAAWMLAALAAPALAVPAAAPALIATALAVVAATAALDGGERPIVGGAPATRRRRALRRLEPYWRWYGLAKLRLDPIYARLDADADPWGAVLDLGCGPGLAAALAATRPGTTRYFGVDLDLDKLLAARRLLAALGSPLDADRRLVHGRLPWSEPPMANADTVLLIDVLHYSPPETQATILRQARHALVPGGRLYLRDGCLSRGSAGRVGWGERFTTFFGLNPPGLHFLAEDELRALLVVSGFAIDACEPSGGANRLWVCRARMGDQ